MKFSDFGFEPGLMEGLEAMGFETATPVQEQAIPPIMEGKDVLACAQTGTGKTAAFLLPVLNRLAQEPNDGIDTLIIEPTRELAQQVDQQLEALSYFTSVSSIAVYGGRDGHAMEQEKRALKRGAPIIVATPGRLTSHLDLGYVKLDSIRHLILDDADRMLDMGFAPAIMNIVNKLPLERQTLLFSATMPGNIRKFARQILRDKKPVEINIAISKPAKNILQAAYEIREDAKLKLAEWVIAQNQRAERILIFAGTKKKVRELQSSLNRMGAKVGAVHSDLAQEERENCLLNFKNGSLPIVVATDVLSRGIDIKGIDVVVNYDVPGDAEDYVHRIGRTARADASGLALTFINAEDRYKFRRIEDLMEMKVRKLPLPPDLKDATPPDRPNKRGGGRRMGGGYNRNKNFKGRKNNRRK
ncbi:MAG: DEAD/DEAH box helicase [Chitinophagales bacterium]|nr:DEAD/DEAH box helicase [Chitinophagales bacterium]